MGEIFRWKHPSQALPFTGERFTSQTSGQVEIEHLHRYFLAREFARGKNVLDIACGEGYGAALLSQVANTVIGIDVDMAAVVHAAHAYCDGHLCFIRADATAIPLKTNSIDVVISFETVEHIYNQEHFVDEICRVLKDDGVFIVSTPDKDIYSPADSAVNPYHVRELTRDEFTALLHRRFELVGSLVQRPMLGSALLPSQGTPGAGPPSTYERRGDDHFERSDGLSRGVYIVAVASHVPVGLPAASLYIETSGVGLRVHETAEIRAANDAFREEAGALRSHNEQLEVLLRTARADNERLEGLFASARSEAERLQALFQSARAENTRLEALLADARSEQARLGGIIESKEAEIARWPSLFKENEARLHAAMLENQQLLASAVQARTAADELTELRSENARLVAELSDAQSATIRMQDEREATSVRLEQIAMRLRIIENSISWRIISPVRRVVHRLLRVSAR